MWAEIRPAFGALVFLVLAAAYAALGAWVGLAAGYGGVYLWGWLSWVLLSSWFVLELALAVRERRRVKCSGS